MKTTQSPLMQTYLFFQTAAQEGFDWNSPFEAALKVKEELEEVSIELHKPCNSLRDQALKEEIGDLFLACTCLAQHCNVEPDDAIALGLIKFQKRFQRFKSYAKEKGISLHEASQAELATMWQLVKQEFTQEN